MNTSGIPVPLGTRSAPPAVRVRNREVPDFGDLVSLLPSSAGALAWVRGGEGLVGWGRLATIGVGGPDRFAAADIAWRQLVGRFEIDDEVTVPGTGAVAFASFAFGDDPGRSVLVLPRVIAGRQGGRCWITELDPVGSPRAARTVGSRPSLPGPRRPVCRSGPPRWRAGVIDAHAFRAAVVEAIRRMRCGPLDKVVLARDLIAEFDQRLDPRQLLSLLATRHERCWTFAVHGLVGATPELLLRRLGPLVESRVLAGTTWPGAGGSTGEALLGSRKQHAEHRFAVDSLLAGLSPWCAAVDTEGPWALRLANVTHLATDVRGVIDRTPGASLLQLAGAIHPTAAVSGSPPRLAAATITELEGGLGLRRGRYAGPVGWIDGRGEGELGLALRCAKISGTTARLFAGCGIVAASDPDTEVAEVAAKFRAIADVLEI